MPIKLFRASRKSSTPRSSSGDQVPHEVLETLLSATAPIGIFETDRRGNCIFVNDRWTQFTGIPKSQAYGQGWVTALHPEDKAEFFASWSRCAGSGAGFSLEYRLRGGDGTFAWVRANVVPVVSKTANEGGFVGIVTNISDRKAAEQALRDSESRLRAIIETAVNGVITIDQTGIVTSFNASSSRIFGWSAEEVVGQPLTMLMPEAYRTLHQSHVENVGKQALPRVLGTGREIVGQRKDGTTFPMEVAISQFRVGSGWMYAGIVRDISERKQIERMKDEFVSVVSHELRTPLTSISGALTLVHGGFAGELPAKASELMEIARKNCTHLMAQLNDILDVENLWAGRTTFSFEYVDLRDLVWRAVEMTRMSEPDAHIDIVNADISRPAYVKADMVRIIQVIGNLLANAIKFSPLNEVVEVRLTQNEKWWRVSVSDFGAGVPRQMRPRMFQRFVHSDGITERAKSGMGLGLAIARSIVAQHGGHIGFDSEETRGATFWFELPVLLGQSEPALGAPVGREMVNAAQ